MEEKNKVQSTNFFGKQLEYHREQRGLTRLALERLISEKASYVSNGVVGRVERGLQTASEALICGAAVALELDYWDEKYLLDMRLADILLKFMFDYKKGCPQSKIVQYEKEGKKG